MKTPRISLSLSLVFVFTSLGLAQEPVVLIRSGDMLEGVEDPIDNTWGVSTNNVGGYVLLLGSGVSSDPGGGGPTVLAGNRVGGPLEVLRVAPPQTGFGTSAGISNTGQLCYLLRDFVEESATVLRDNTAVAVSGEPSTIPGEDWGHFESTRISADGQPFFIMEPQSGGDGDDPSGLPGDPSLFLGVNALPVIQPGDVFPGLPFPVQGMRGSGGFDYDFSACRSRWLAAVRMDDPDRRTAILKDSAALEVGSAFVAVGEPIPQSIGGLAGEEYFGFVGGAINEAGNYALGTRGAIPGVSTRYLLIVDGVVAASPGDVVDGVVIENSQIEPMLNEEGNLAFLAEISDPGLANGQLRDGLFFEGELVLSSGDPFDWDGDGTPDPGVSIGSIFDPALGSDNTVYAGVSVQGVDPGLSAIAIIAIPCPVVAYGEGKVNSLGMQSELTGAGFPSLATNDFRFEIEGCTRNAMGVVLWSPNRAELPFFGGTRYVGNPLARMRPILTDVTGRAVQSVRVEAPMVGERRYFQFFHRDVNAPDGTGVELTNGLSVTFHP